MPNASAPTNARSAKKAPKPKNPKWKVMIYFGSDNPLSPLLVSQLKAIKDAGFQTNTDVLVYFDPMEIGVPTKLYNVNRSRREALGQSLIGDGPDPFVRNMIEDEIGPNEIPPKDRDVLAGTAKQANAFHTLRAFIDFGLTVRPAENYILILVGHGMIVGNDAFLPDQDPISAITLKQLGELAAKFGRNDKTLLRLLALHSCSMSSLELAYQLKGTADYLMATQGPAFVTSWPYRQLLKKILNNVNRANRRQKAVDVQALVEKLYYLTLYNATDYMSVGYSADVALINLKRKHVTGIKGDLTNLIRQLKRGLHHDCIKELILLAHLESQSFFEENYSDLYDFCSCLLESCRIQLKCFESLASKDVQEVVNESKLLRSRTKLVISLVKDLERLGDACGRVILQLSPVRSNRRPKRFEAFVIHEDNFGSEFQFSHGLSIYFPWSEPLDEERLRPPKKIQGQLVRARAKVIKNYETYEFTKDFKEDSWLSFLLEYFDMTQRQSLDGNTASREDQGFLREASRLFFDGILSQKPTPEVGTRTPDQGVGCDCPSIKNFPIDRKRNFKKFYATPAVLRAFRDPRLRDELLNDE